MGIRLIWAELVSVIVLEYWTGVVFKRTIFNGNKSGLPDFRQFESSFSMI